MYSEKVNAQDFAVKVLRNHLRSGRLSHTYLLTGEAPSGKEEVAAAFASALNCLENKWFEECACNSCHKMENGNHPDFHVLGEDESVKSIKIEEIRGMISESSLKPYEGKWKVFFLKKAERLTPDASNAVLKTLEEPSEHTIFILTTETKANLLETIQSRAFELRLKPLGANQNHPSLDLVMGIKEKAWEDYLDENTGKRENMRETLTDLMLYFRQSALKAVLPSGEPDPRQESFVKALELLTETKDALDANVNQKILASRLAMRLRRIVPQGK